MSKLKKLGSMLLALVFALGMTCTALAADITITGAQSGHTYTAYQILDGDLSADGNTLSNVTWGANVTDGNALLAALKDDSTLGTLFGSCTSAADVADVLANLNTEQVIAFAALVDGYVSNGTASTAESDGSYTIDNLDAGYYLVVDTTVSSGLEDGDAYSRNILLVAGSETIATKTVYPSLEKEANDESVEVGQTVTFTLTSTVPDTTGYSVYDYIVSDTMGTGLSFDGTTSITVTIGDTSVTDYTATATSSGFTLTLDMTKYTAGAKVVITYTATVTEDAVATVTTNTATLKYSNNPNDSTSTDKITDTDEVYSAKVVIDKYDGDTAEKLANATFVLYKYDTDGTTKLYYAYDEETDKVSWVSESDKTKATSKTTNSDGSAEFIGLENGTYYLEETAAPDGYNTASDTKVTIEGSTTGTGLSVTAEVENKSGSKLPSTGGMGTTIFYIVGGVLAAGAVVLLITKKRMAE